MLTVGRTQPVRKSKRNSVKTRDDTDNRTGRRQRGSGAGEREREKGRGGDGELNMGRREGEMYFKLETQVRVNRRRDRKPD